MNKIGSKIKALRELKNLTQDFVASEIGMNQASFSKIESGETDLTFSKLEQIASVFGLQPEDIICFNQKMVFNVMYNRKATGLTINQISASEKKLYDEYIQTLKSEINFLKKAMEKILNQKNNK